MIGHRDSSRILLVTFFGTPYSDDDEVHNNDEYSDDGHLREKESPPDASSQKASREG